MRVYSTFFLPPQKNGCQTRNSGPALQRFSCAAFLRRVEAGISMLLYYSLLVLLGALLVHYLRPNFLADLLGGKSSARGASHVIAIIPRDAVSIFKMKPLQTAVSWREVLEQVQVKLGWEELNVTLSIVEVEELLRRKGPLAGDVAILVGIKGEEADLGGARLKRLEESVRGFKAIAPFDCSGSVLTMLAKGGIEVADESSPGISFGSADEMVFTILVLVNNFAKSIPKIARQLAPPTATLSQLACFGWNCYRDFTNCINNPLCKQTMTCMSQCK